MKYLQQTLDKAVILDKLPATVYEKVYLHVMSKLYTKDDSGLYWGLRKQLYRPLNSILQWNLHKTLEVGLE